MAVRGFGGGGGGKMTKNNVHPGGGYSGIFLAGRYE